MIKLVSLSSERGSRGLIHEKIDAVVKEQIRNDKGVGSEAAGYWFEDVLVPALSRLDEPALSSLLDAWPSSLLFELNHPSKVVGSNRFWGCLKANGDATRDKMLADVLPQLTDASSWSAKERFNMLPDMFALARSEAEFHKRLRLWTAWGGDLDTPLPADNAGPEIGFSSPVQPPITARAWLLAHAAPSWNSVLEAYPIRDTTRRGPTLG
jgi:hypothetical protein